LPYLEQKRLYGEGEVRIGNRLTLGDDIYCTGFIAYLSDDILKKTLNIMTGELIESEEKNSVEDIKLH
jgi:hypothetical protein